MLDTVTNWFSKRDKRGLPVLDPLKSIVLPVVISFILNIVEMPVLNLVLVGYFAAATIAAIRLLQQTRRILGVLFATEAVTRLSPVAGYSSHSNYLLDPDKRQQIITDTAAPSINITTYPDFIRVTLTSGPDYGAVLSKNFAAFALATFVPNPRVLTPSTTETSVDIPGGLSSDTTAKADLLLSKFFGVSLNLFTAGFGAKIMNVVQEIAKGDQVRSDVTGVTASAADIPGSRPVFGQPRSSQSPVERFGSPTADNPAKASITETTSLCFWTDASGKWYAQPFDPANPDRKGTLITYRNYLEFSKPWGEFLK